MNMQPKLFAIFGNPVAHSKSPLMHNLVFKTLGYNGCYVRYLLDDGKELKKRFFQLGLSGINITVPHKEMAFDACDWIDPFALKVGSVNTIINKEGKLQGYNTDAPGFLESIKEFKEVKNVLILGAGGTAKSTSHLLKDSGIEVEILGRNKTKLKQFENDCKCYSFDDFSPKPYSLIINMTSAGLQDDLLPAPRDLLLETIDLSLACVDIIYGKDTPFLKLAKTLQKPTQDGSAMLLHQGILASFYFTDKQFATQEIKAVMKQAFALD